MISLLKFLIPVGVVGAVVCYRKELYNILRTLRYELIYWFIGGIAVGDDILYFWKNKLKELPRRTGDVAIVTGGARGIGLEVVKKLLEADMTVIVACRNPSAGNAAVQALRDSGLRSGQVDVLQLDVCSMGSVRTFAAAFRAKYKKLNLLINNAGVMFVPFTLTEDGFETHNATNYLGHFLLTHLLMEPLVAAGRDSSRQSRVVNVSSCAHLPGSINFKDFNYHKSFYIPSQVYAQSKLAQVMFSNAVERKLQSKKLQVAMFSLHPGVVNTDLFDGTLLRKIAPWVPKLFFKTPQQGAVTILHTALSKELEGRGGAYITNCREMWTSKAAADSTQQEKLMQLTQNLLQIEDFGDLDRL